MQYLMIQNMQNKPDHNMKKTLIFTTLSLMLTLGFASMYFF